MVRTNISRGTTLAVAALAACVGCGKDAPPTGAPEQTPQEAFCGQLGTALGACATGGDRCAAALGDDCADLAGVLDETFLSSAAECLRASTPLGACFARALEETPVSEAQRSLAHKLCTSCALGAPSCEEILTGEGAGAGTPRELEWAAVVLRPLGADVASEIERECTEGLTCLAMFPTCVQSVLARRAVPEAALGCFAERLVDPAEPAECSIDAGGGSGDHDAGSPIETPDGGTPISMDGGGRDMPDGGGGGTDGGGGGCVVTWSSEVVDPAGIATNMAVTLTADGRAHVAYAGGAGELRYAVRSTEGAWSVSTIVPAAYLVADDAVALAIDGTGAAHFAYATLPATPNVVHALRDASGRVTQHTVGRGTQPSIAIDATGGAHVSYFEDIVRDLVYAYRSPTGIWRTETAHASWAPWDDVGQASSIAVPSLDVVWVSYHDHFNTDLRFAWRESSTGWHDLPVDATGSTGHGSVLAIDSSGAAHVAYFERRDGERNDVLKHALRQRDGTWVTAMVDTGLVTSSGVALSFGAGGEPRLTYVASDTTVRTASATTPAGGSWSMETSSVPGLTLGPATRIVIDASNTTHVIGSLSRTGVLHAYQTRVCR